LEEQVLPDSVAESKRSKDGKKALVITNTGGVRFDIFKGAYTKDTTFLVSPFTSGMRYIKNVPFKAASRVLKLLNSEGPILDAMQKESTYLQPPESVAMQMRPEILSKERAQDSELYNHDSHAQAPIGEDTEPLIPGYTTKDDAGEDGDDTLHAPIQFYQIPNCIQASVNIDPSSTEDEPEKVDLLYNEFIEKWVLLALEYLGEKYEEGDTENYFENVSITEIMTEWVKRHWHVEADEECPS
jgi:hypothetical protein